MKAGSKGQKINRKNENKCEKMSPLRMKEGRKQRNKERKKKKRPPPPLKKKKEKENKRKNERKKSTVCTRASAIRHDFSTATVSFHRPHYNVPTGIVWRRVWLVVCCITSQRHARVSQGQICSDR